MKRIRLPKQRDTFATLSKLCASTAPAARLNRQLMQHARDNRFLTASFIDREHMLRTLTCKQLLLHLPRRSPKSNMRRPSVAAATSAQQTTSEAPVFPTSACCKRFRSIRLRYTVDPARAPKSVATRTHWLGALQMCPMYPHRDMFGPPLPRARPLDRRAPEEV